MHRITKALYKVITCRFSSAYHVDMPRNILILNAAIYYWKPGMSLIGYLFHVLLTKERKWGTRFALKFES
jgi:hypothetical protein